MLACGIILLGLLSSALADVNVQLCNKDCSECQEEVHLASEFGSCFDTNGAEGALLWTLEPIPGSSQWCSLWAEYVLSFLVFE